MTRTRSHESETTAPSRHIEALRPESPDQLHRFLKIVLGINFPREALMEGNTPPFAYLAHTFFEEGGCGDAVVWANRGGGKTYMGAVATLLDLVFKPGIQVRILGGSFDQSSKMYRYLCGLFEHPVLSGLVMGEPTQRRVRLVNGSVAEVLSQSQRSVRGEHAHKIRCDEVEEFDRDVWEAAQLATRSGKCGDRDVRGSVEALSTMHRPFGLMGQLVDRAKKTGDGKASVFRWCAIDVIERCPPERDCESCVLWNDCRGLAKSANGYFRVDDLVTQWHRSSREVWDSEMMCKRPRRSDCVYPGFDASTGGTHVLIISSPVGETANQQTIPGAKDERTGQTATPADGNHTEKMVLIGGMDFGLRSPFVMLWARLWPDDISKVGDHPKQLPKSSDCVVEVIDEYVETGLTLDQHVAAIEKREHPMPYWVGVDPAGGQRNSHTGLTDIEVLRRYGYKVKFMRSSIRWGVECVRRRLDHGTIRIDGSCRQLIEALSCYHFDPEHPERDEPVKDGPDHLCDALRYMIVNLDRAGQSIITRKY